MERKPTRPNKNFCPKKEEPLSLEVPKSVERLSDSESEENEGEIDPDSESEPKGTGAGMMMDDYEDIYGDLELESCVFQRTNYETTKSKSKPELEARILELEEQVVKLHKDNNTLKSRIKEVFEENKNLEFSLNSLLETAQEETSRKDFMLTNLQKKFTEQVTKKAVGFPLSREELKEFTELIKSAIKEAGTGGTNSLISAQELKAHLDQCKVRRREGKDKLSEEEKKTGNWTRTFKFGNCNFYHYSSEQIPFGRLHEVILPVPLVEPTTSPMSKSKPMISKKSPETEFNGKEKKHRNPGSSSVRSTSSESTSGTGKRGRSPTKPTQNNNSRGGSSGHSSSNTNGKGRSSNSCRSNRADDDPRSKNHHDDSTNTKPRSQSRRSEDLRKELDRRSLGTRSSPRKSNNPNYNDTKRPRIDQDDHEGRGKNVHSQRPYLEYSDSGGNRR